MTVRGCVLGSVAGVAMCVLMCGIVAAEQPATRPAGMMEARGPFRVGEVAAEIRLEDLEGKPVVLSEMVGKGPVVVMFLRGWVGYQCPLCTKQVGDFLAHADELKAAGARVVMIYPGPASEVKAKAKEFFEGMGKKGLPEGFVVVTDPGLVAVDAYHVRWDQSGETAYPSTFVVGAERKVLFAKVSHSHGDRASAAAVVKVLGKK